MKLAVFNCLGIIILLQIKKPFPFSSLLHFLTEYLNSKKYISSMLPVSKLRATTLLFNITRCLLFLLTNHHFTIYESGYFFKLPRDGISRKIHYIIYQVCNLNHQFYGTTYLRASIKCFQFHYVVYR